MLYKTIARCSYYIVYPCTHFVSSIIIYIIICTRLVTRFMLPVTTVIFRLLDTSKPNFGPFFRYSIRFPAEDNTLPSGVLPKDDSPSVRLFPYRFSVQMQHAFHYNTVGRRVRKRRKARCVIIILFFFPRSPCVCARINTMPY